MSVNPGKTYIYNITYTVGARKYYNIYPYKYITPITVTSTIAIPTPQDEAKEAALAAKTAAVAAKDSADDAYYAATQSYNTEIQARDIAQKAFTAAEEARMKVYKVMTNKSFNELMYGEISGTYGDSSNKVSNYLIVAGSDGCSSITFH